MYCELELATSLPKVLLKLSLLALWLDLSFGVISFALLVAVDLSASSSIDDGRLPACFEPAGPADAAAAVVVAVVAAAELICFRKRDALSLSQPSSSASIFSSISCRQASL